MRINTFDVRAYIELCDSGRLPTALEARLSPLEVATYYAFWRLYEGVIDRRRFAEVCGVGVERALPGLIAALRVVGYLRRDGRRYVLTRRGLDFYHSIERWVTYQYIEPTWAACRSRAFPGDLRL